MRANQAGVPDVVGEVDRGHAPTPELALEHVAVSQTGGEARRVGAHLEIIFATNTSLWRSSMAKYGRRPSTAKESWSLRCHAK